MIGRALALLGLVPLAVVAAVHGALTWRPRPRRDPAQVDYDLRRM
jgi:hypothetical protein